MTVVTSGARSLSEAGVTSEMYALGTELRSFARIVSFLTDE